MSENLRHWSALSKTDPKHTKSFTRAGGFKGTATKPIWTEYRLTEHFGPCGVGWGCDAPEFSLVPAGEEILVFCTVRAWYMDDTGRAELYGVGGDKVLVKQQSGLRTDDEAYKKAFTDALGNAFKHVGSGADVHMGLFEDSKYLAEVRREFAEESTAPPAGERNAAPPSQTAPNGNASVASFWARGDYGIDPEVITGGLPAWDGEFLRAAEHAPNIDALLKLKADNKPHHATWYKKAAGPVRESFAMKIAAIESNLLARPA